MGLNIKNPETEARIRMLAAMTGEKLTEAVDTAVRARIEKMRDEKEAQEAYEEKRQKMEEILAKIRSYPINNDLTEDEILGYDENGIPS